MKTSRHINMNVVLSLGARRISGSGLAENTPPQPPSFIPPLPEGATVGFLMEELRKGVARPELYKHYRRDLLRVKIDDRYHIRLRRGQLADVERHPDSGPGDFRSLGGSDYTITGARSFLSDTGSLKALQESAFAIWNTR